MSKQATRNIKGLSDDDVINVIGQTLDPVLHKPPAPLANSVLMHPEPRTNLLALKPFRAK